MKYGKYILRFLFSKFMKEKDCFPVICSAVLRVQRDNKIISMI